jgi:hypothetical protein
MWMQTVQGVPEPGQMTPGSKHQSRLISRITWALGMIVISIVGKTADRRSHNPDLAAAAHCCQFI